MGQQVVQLTNGKNGKPFIRYRNCMRNHAASMGGHSVDGCEEFMPGGEEGTREARRCAACGCHRNFHKKELPEGFADQNFQHPQPFLPMLPYNAMVPNPKFRWDKMGDGFASLPTFSVSQPSPFYYQRLFGAVKQTDEEKSDPWLETAERGEVQSIMNKRFKTEVMQEQKNKMMEFAERLGRRLHKHDEVAVGRFCDEVGVERDVLEEWMHNKSELHQKENALPVPPSRVN